MPQLLHCLFLPIPACLPVSVTPQVCLSASVSFPLSCHKLLSVDSGELEAQRAEGGAGVSLSACRWSGVSLAFRGLGTLMLKGQTRSNTD